MTYTNEEYQVYLKVQKALLLEDARFYFRDALAEKRDVWADEIEDDEIETVDFESMVKQFEEKTDYFDPTADVWTSIARDAVDDYLYEIGEA